ncbi:methyltransferase [Croceicoccus sp. F390]|uniref:Methyltransferase n=1 Tax=Croceicoccus esteveae TaxID=3075597 RepID=A0ABU2ZHB5_9SPHN|nr:methyltransferase [Croceicoccus sp. F390]MDT0575775.1 methyltransferase [Croceicoccus sp. F390]
MTGTQLARQSLARRAKRSVEQALGPWGVFFKGFVQHPVMVGSIIPSSRFTINRMLSRVDWQRCDLFVEYGPGVGTFCQPVLDRMKRDARLIVIDTNPLYIDYLNRTVTDGRFTAVLGSAADVQEIIAARGHEGADYILSGLPFSTLPDGVGPAIVDATHEVLRAGGAFLVYQFSARARSFMARRFSRIESDFEPLNVLPCRLFWGWKDQADASQHSLHDGAHASGRIGMHARAGAPA